MFDHLRLSLVALALSTSAAASHEFWIDPHDFTVAPDAMIEADLRVGQDFDGVAYAFLPQRFRLFDLALGDKRIPVEGRIGDSPALAQTPLGEGLNVVLHVTTDTRLTWSGWDKFTDFVTHKDAGWVLDAHERMGSPKTGILEIYSRHAKSLIAVGDGTGADRAYGLLTEIVALANPYTDDLSAGLPVQVLYDGAPRPMAQVEIFARLSDGTVSDTTVKADAEGIAIVPVEPGVTYMLDSVVLRRPDPGVKAATGALWESLWANLTFQTPG